MPKELTREQQEEAAYHQRKRELQESIREQRRGYKKAIKLLEQQYRAREGIESLLASIEEVPSAKDRLAEKISAAERKEHAKKSEHHRFPKGPKPYFTGQFKDEYGKIGKFAASGCVAIRKPLRHHSQKKYEELSKAINTILKGTRNHSFYRSLSKLDRERLIAAQIMRESGLYANPTELARADYKRLQEYMLKAWNRTKV